MIMIKTVLETANTHECASDNIVLLMLPLFLSLSLTYTPLCHSFFYLIVYIDKQQKLIKILVF